MKGATRFACSAGKQAPVQARLDVVDRVVAVVVRPPVDELADEVARVVVLAVLVAAVVLEEVHRDDAPGRVLVRDEHVEEELLPVEREQRAARSDEEDRLDHHLAEPRPGSAGTSP